MRKNLFRCVIAALLVVGIMHMGAWLSWPAALATKSEQREAILGWTTSVTVYWGATFSLVVIAAYVPAGWLLLSRARQTLRNEMSEDELEKWLQEYSLTVAPKHQLSRLAVILAPMLAGPVGGMISRALSGSGE